jgi:recombination protein RecT
MAQTTNIQELRKQARTQSVATMGGSNVQQFFEANKNALAAVLPKHMHADRMLKVAMHALRTTPALSQCNVQSLMGAVVQCSQLGLEPNTVLGHAYLVPFNNKKARKTDVQLILGYKGLIDLARRSGQIESIGAYPVHENDDFHIRYGTDPGIDHSPSIDGERGRVIGFYAVARFKGGGHQFEFMSRHEVDQVMASSQSRGKYGPWAEHYVEMGRKTVIRRLAKYLPLSIEFATAATLDGMAEAGRDQNLDGVLDGEYSVMPDDAPQALDESEPEEAPPETEEPPPADPPQETSAQASPKKGSATGQQSLEDWEAEYDRAAEGKD